MRYSKWGRHAGLWLCLGKNLREQGSIPDDSGTNRPLQFESCIIAPNTSNRVVIGDSSYSDNSFSLTSTYRQVSPGISGKPWDVMRIRISCLAVPSPSLRSHAAQSICRIHGGLAMDDMMNGA